MTNSPATTTTPCDWCDLPAVWATTNTTNGMTHTDHACKGHALTWAHTYGLTDVIARLDTTTR